MADVPEGLSHERHHDLLGRRVEPWLRRAALTVILAAVVASLAGLIGQRSSTTRAVAPPARLEVSAPGTVRGGLLFEARITVVAGRAIAHPRLVLDPGWLDGLQVNTIEPSPTSEAGRDGRLVLSYPALAKGDRLVVHLQFQANPTNVGTTANAVELDDAATPLVAIHRRLRRLP